MMPDIYSKLMASSAVTTLMGSPKPRIYPWSGVPQNAAKPYATYGVYNGNPQNFLDQAPDMDNKGTQIDIWADTAASASACFAAIRDVLEPIGHMLSFSGVNKDAETQLYNARMEFDFWEAR